MLEAADVGYRVVVRHRLPGGSATDALGVLTGLTPAGPTVRRAGGEEVVIAAADVLAARRVPPSPVRVRAATPADAEGIERLRIAGWRAGYPGLVPADYLAAMTPDPGRRRASLAEPEPGSVTVVALVRRVLVGWCAGGPSRDPAGRDAGEAEVYACYVHPDHWRAGVGRRVLGRVLAALTAAGPRPVTLHVLAGNDRAVAFYRRAGFVPDGPAGTIRAGADLPQLRLRRPAQVGGVGQGDPG